MAITRIGGANAITGTIPTSVAPGKGKVLQVVQATSTGGSDTTSTSYVATALTAAITPSSTSSKILIVTKVTANGSPSTDVNTRIYKASTSITGNASTKYNSSSGEPSDMVNTFLDSPNTTSATTYTLYAQSSVNGQQIKMNSGNTDGTITLMEIAG